jgi:hypothetical protein
MIWIITIIIGFAYANYLSNKWADALNPYNFFSRNNK